MIRELLLSADLTTDREYSAHARQSQHIGDQTRQTLALIVDETVIVASALIVGSALAQHLAVRADGHQRRLEFMTDRRYEVPLNPE